MEIMLSKMKVGDLCKVKKVEGDVHLRRRLFELGILTGDEVKVLSVSPMKNSFIISVKGYALAVRKNILEKIWVEKI